MKITTVLGALVIQCAAAKSWNNDSYSEEAYSVFGWIGYLKRVFLVALMLFGVILYYVPESRPHARRICYALIDVTANSLKSALRTRESEYMYEKIKSRYNHSRHDPSLLMQKRIAQEIQADEDHERVQRNYKKSTSFTDGDGILENKERKRVNGKQNKEHRQSRHRFRNSIIKDVSAEPCTDVAKPVYFYSDKLEDIQKYLKTNLSGTKRANGSGTDNYAFLISGNPQQIAMLEHKYEKDDVVIMQEPYLRVEYKECGTSTDKLSSKADGSGSEQEGPTRDNNNLETDSGMEACLRDVELNSIPENSGSRYSANKFLYQSSQFQCGGECCGPNGCSVSSADLSTREGVKNALKSSRSMVTPNLHKSAEKSAGNVYVVNHDSYLENERPMKSVQSSNSRKVDFRKEAVICAEQNHDETGYQFESTSRVRRKMLRHNDPRRGGCCNGVPYSTDRGGESVEENSPLERLTSNDNLDERPEKENALHEKDSDDSALDCIYDDLDGEPIFKNRLRPALVRAVNWIFGGCPEARKRAALNRRQVGKEENQELTDEWLL